jgi:hypothetical protein
MHGEVNKTGHTEGLFLCRRPDCRPLSNSGASVCVSYKGQRYSSE